MQIRNLTLLFLIVSIFNSNAQKAELDKEELVNKKPVAFTHIPFLVLRLNPMALMQYDNMLQYGAEIAPPFGKFSVVFDYGKGKGSQNFRKNTRKNYADNTSKELHAEIRTYFSDWYPFYALDKKPFGRYYALEYIKGDYSRSFNINYLDNKTLVSFKENTQTFRVKFGKNIHLHKHLFLDLNGGMGLCKFKTEASNLDFSDTAFPDLKLKFLGLNVRKFQEPDNSGWRFSTVLNARLAIPL